MSYIQSAPDIDGDKLSVERHERAFSYRYVIRLTDSITLYLSESDAQNLHALLGEAIGEAELQIEPANTPGGFSDE